MEQLINVKYISSCGDNNLYTAYISRFYENLNYRRKYDPLFHFYYIFYISSSSVLILYKSIENWCYKQIKLTPWRCVHFDFVPNFQCSWRDFERTGVKYQCADTDVKSMDLNTEFLKGHLRFLPFTFFFYDILFIIYCFIFYFMPFYDLPSTMCCLQLTF